MSITPQTPPFSTHAREVVHALRSAFADIVHAAGADPNVPQSLSHQLGLNKNLAWKIAKIIQADDPSVALEQLPGSNGLKIFLRAAERSGADPDQLQAAHDAITGFERLIQIHSGDRATLEMMSSELSPNGRAQRDEYHRKQLFQGASYVWGAQARVTLKVGVEGPGSEPGLLDLATINALVDFRRIRSDVTWVMGARSSSNDDGTGMATDASEAIDRRFDASDQPPLMGDFCSQPLPALRRFSDGNETRFELVEGPAGNPGALTCVVGAIQRSIPYYRTPTNEWGAHLAKCDIPAELLILDLYIHRDFDFAFPPEPVLYSDLARTVAEGDRDRYRLPLHEKLQELGSSHRPPITPEVPRYGPMVNTVFERTGWDPREFRGFRMKLAYPPYPTALVLRYPLPDPPGE